MALDVKLCYTAVTSDCADLTLTDETTYGSGELERVYVGVYTYLYKLDWDPDVDNAQLVIQSYDAETVTDWIVKDTTKDGHYRAKQYVVERWFAGNYLADDIVTYGGYLWEAQSNTSGEPGVDAIWEQVTDQLDDLDSLPRTITEGISDFVVFCRSEKCFATVVARVAQEGRCGTCDEGELGNLYRRIDVLLNAAFVAEAQLRYEDADEIVVTIQELCEDFENCNC